MNADASSEIEALENKLDLEQERRKKLEVRSQESEERLKKVEDRFDRLVRLFNKTVLDVRADIKEVSRVTAGIEESNELWRQAFDNKLEQMVSRGDYKKIEQELQLAQVANVTLHSEVQRQQGIITSLMEQNERLHDVQGETGKTGSGVSRSIPLQH